MDVCLIVWRSSFDDIGAGYGPQMGKYLGALTPQNSLAIWFKIFAVKWSVLQFNRYLMKVLT